MVTEKEYERVKKLATNFDEYIHENIDDEEQRWSVESYFYGLWDILTECPECRGRGYITEYIVEYNGGESAPEWSGEYQVQCPCTYEMPLRDVIAYERWQLEGELNESENNNTR
tara:strand:+ start:192 stop:533 length:342 start_codon:yes stop_codon:yes gene_type:complete